MWERGVVRKIEGAYSLLSLVNSTGKSQDTSLNLFGFATAAATKEFNQCLCDSSARFKRRISHVPNLTRELNACEVRRLNQLNSTV